MCVYCRLNEKKDSKYIIRKDGKYAMTEDGKKVPKICPECGAEMTLQIKGEPIYICKNGHYFGTMKFSLKEGFEFDSVNKNKKKLNAVDIIFWNKLNAITEKIINYDKNTILSYDEKEFMLSLSPNTYLTNDEDIKPLVRNYMKIFGYDCDLNWIDTSNVTDMSYLFDEIRSFTGNVSEWNVSNVTDMGNMFGSTNFNGDLSKWDVSNVTNMDSMFEFSLFNGDISNWDVSNVTDMSYMFMESQFNGDISKWDVSNVEVMTCMFYKSQFNGDISKWDVSNVINMKRMFYKSPFSGNLDNWDVSNVSNLVKIFQKTPLESNPPLWYTKKVKEWNGVLKESFDFDSVNKQKKSINVYDAILTKIVLKILYKSRLSKEDRNVILSLPVASYKTNDSEIHLLIEKCIDFFGPTCNLNWIDTSNVTNMKKLFWETEFNGDISLWNVSNVTDMTAMFCSLKDSIYAFNGDLNNWDVSNVTIMESMFMGACGVNPSISKWDVSNVKDMYQMFAWNQKFDDDISNWNVGNVRNMGLMFYESGFNGDLSKWDVSNVQDMHGMFSSSSFKGNNGSLNNWNVSNVTNMRGMFRSTFFNSDISNWDVSNVIHMRGIFYNSTFNKDISNWDINPVANTTEMFDRCDIIDEYKPKKLIKESFDFDSIDKVKKTINVYNNVYPIIEKIINYKKINNISMEEYNQLILYTGIYKPLNKEELKIIIKKFINYFGNNCVLNWIDVSNITDMSELFYNSKFNGDISLWNVSNVTNMDSMFDGTKFNGNISKWNVSNVTNMSHLFCYSKFNGDISKWNVSNVTDMSNMFGRSVFNQDISQWDVSNVTNIAHMFCDSKFNKDISSWDVSKVENMRGMFSYSKFTGDISKWDVSNVTDMSSIFIKCPIKEEYKPKFKIQEAFDFDSIRKEKNAINAYDKLPGIFKKVTAYQTLSDDEYYILTSMVGVYKVKTADKLKSVINYFIKLHGNNCVLNWIDTHDITNMSGLFFSYKFNGNISLWDVSNVTDMSIMFTSSAFNGDISNWNVSNVTNMKAMFWKSKFNSDISSWDVSNVMDARAMFMETEFNQDISNWHFNDNAITSDMFMACPIKNEYKPKMIRVNEAFDFHSVNKQKKQINAYDTIYPIIKKIIVNEINNISDDEYNQLISYTCIYKPQNKEELKEIIKEFINYFGDDCNLNWIDISDVTDMSFLFEESRFNGDISKWDVSHVTNMRSMFLESKFNGDISKWNVSNVINMSNIFSHANFNGDISLWNVSNVKNMCFMFNSSRFNGDISKWIINPKCKTTDMFMACPIKNEYKPKMIRMNEAFDFNSINDTRSKDALKTIEKLQHEQDFIDVPKIKGSELTKLKGFVAGMLKTDPEIHYTYTQDKDNVNGRILKIFTNNHVLHMFVKKYLALKSFLDAKGIELKIVPVCDQGKLNIWYTGQTELGIAPNEYQFDLDTNASVLKGWKINNIILDGFVVSFWSTYDNEGGRSGLQLYLLAHNSQHVYLYNCSYSPNKKEMNKRIANVLHHKLKHLKHSALHLKAAICSINNGKDVDILALKWLGEAFDFNALKDTSKTGILRTVDAYLETAFKTDIIAAKTTAVRKAIEGYIKSIRRYDNEGNLYFEYTEEDNVLKIKMVNPNLEICFNTSPTIKLSSKMFNLGKSLPKIEFLQWKAGAKILNIQLNTGLSMEDIAVKGHSLTYYIEHGLYMLDLKHIALNNLILHRFILSDEDISYLYDLNVKHIFTPKSRFTGVTKMINYKEFMNFPHISFTNNLGKTPKGLFMDEIEQVSNYE